MGSINKINSGHVRKAEVYQKDSTEMMLHNNIKRMAKKCIERSVPIGDFQRSVLRSGCCFHVRGHDCRRDVCNNCRVSTKSGHSVRDQEIFEPEIELRIGNELSLEHMECEQETNKSEGVCEEKGMYLKDNNVFRKKLSKEKITHVFEIQLSQNGGENEYNWKELVKGKKDKNTETDVNNSRYKSNENRQVDLLKELNDDDLDDKSSITGSRFYINTHRSRGGSCP